MISTSTYFAQMPTLTLLSIIPSALWASIDCTTLDDKTDQTVCQNVVSNSSYASGRDWLNSVQKISSGTVITEELLANQSSLYIFDSEAANGERAVYNFPPTVNMPADTAVVGNGTETSKPHFILESSEDGNEFSAAERGYNLVQNVEISTHIVSSGAVQQIFFVSGIEGITLSGVTLSGEYTPSESDTISSLSMLSLGATDGGATSVSIVNSEFLLPEIGPVNHRTAIVGVRVVGSLSSQSDDDLMTLNFKNNHVVSRDYNKEGGQVVSAALQVVGHVKLDNSRCNSVTDRQGKGVLTQDNFQSWLSGFNPTVANQALGFRNGYGWGWREEGEQTLYRFDTWDGWSQYGVDISCGDPDPAGNRSGGSSLAVKIAVPIVVVVVLVGVGVASLFGGHKLRKRWSASRINRAANNLIGHQEPL